MKKQIYFVSSIIVCVLLMILLSIQTASAEEFKFMPASTEHIMEAAKAMKADESLGVYIINYSEEIIYHNIDDLVISVRDVEEAFLYVDIDPDRLVVGFANKGGELEKNHEFKADGVYIRLFRSCE